ncbi:hypothetical protein C3L33_06092, partial [Rhododendron williamsianum]
MDNNKQTKGRQRIDTSKRRESEEDRLITFSKRRSGLYKKGSELCTLCGTQLAILIFSPSGKPFSFAHPNIEVIAKRVLETNPRSDDQDSNGVMDAYRRNSIDELNEQLSLLSNEVEYEKERGTKLAQTTKARHNKPLCEQKIDELGGYDAQKLKAWLIELQARINNRLEELNVAQATRPSAVGAIDGNASSSSYGHWGIHFKNFN